MSRALYLQHPRASRSLLKVLPRVLPPDWAPLPTCPTPEGAAYSTRDGLRIIVSLDTEDNGTTWLHISVSRRDRLPSWDDLKRAKELLIGKDKPAIQILPPESEYVNLHPNCLHMWAIHDGDWPIPGFFTT